MSGFRTPAERSMDRLNAKAARLRGLTNPSDHERRELETTERQLRAARRAVFQMREGLR